MAVELLLFLFPYLIRFLTFVFARLQQILAISWLKNKFSQNIRFNTVNVRKFQGTEMRNLNPSQNLRGF